MPDCHSLLLYFPFLEDGGDTVSSILQTNLAMERLFSKELCTSFSFKPFPLPRGHDLFQQVVINKIKSEARAAMNGCAGV